MRNLFDNGAAALPGKLAGDLDVLLAYERAAALTWQDLRDESPEARWFQALWGAEGEELALAFRFWIHEWMDERAIAAILPARLGVASIEKGRWARVTFATGTRSQLRGRVAAAGRCAARLVNELWGRTEADHVWLEEYAEATDELAADLTTLPAWWH